MSNSASHTSSGDGLNHQHLTKDRWATRIVLCGVACCRHQPYRSGVRLLRFCGVDACHQIVMTERNGKLMQVQLCPLIMDGYEECNIATLHIVKQESVNQCAQIRGFTLHKPFSTLSNSRRSRSLELMPLCSCETEKWLSILLLSHFRIFVWIAHCVRDRRRHFEHFYFIFPCFWVKILSTNSGNRMLACGAQSPLIHDHSAPTV
jgi:hypothetical protein